ncbi:glycoside hydrolase family 6 protein [Curtobacterium sp. RHCJP20]|uniref:Glucanase n=1 Tax=Curtobacterium subtropicum TaxID=3055138 RepID=A0ABT7THT0_9MICO|nr:glycoside hydrolase family 6 protein [Curtobacterium subtropicum]MDM7889128.1 glycoside hydrolase family 6 protein [Curtobacterium subtropicum]
MHSRTRTTVARALALATVLAATVAGTVVVADPTAASAAAVGPLPPAALHTATPGQVFAGGLFVQPDSQAAQAATALGTSGTATEAAAARTIAQQPVAIWLGEWYTGEALDRVIARNLAAAERVGRTPVFVTYAVPNRDCGGYSAGGLSPSEYAEWNRRIAADLRGHRAVVIVEPDSLSHLSTCTAERARRPGIIAGAVHEYATAGVPTYLDGGNENWNDPELQATYLRGAGIAEARGFFTNVANFYRVDGERAYAERLSALTGGARYVIDTSRNARGWLGTWCNPTGAGLGRSPHVAAGRTRLDALLWIKTPGASDGTCNGGPAAGTWYPSYAVALVANRKR